MSEYRDNAVEAMRLAIGRNRHSSATSSALAVAALQAADKDLERMYFERFKEAVLSDGAVEAAARWPHEQEVPGVWLDDDSWEFEEGHDPRDNIRADAKASLEAALSKAQQLMEEADRG